MERVAIRWMTHPLIGKFSFPVLFTFCNSLVSYLHLCGILALHSRKINNWMLLLKKWKLELVNIIFCCSFYQLLPRTCFTYPKKMSYIWSSNIYHFPAFSFPDHFLVWIQALLLLYIAWTWTRKIVKTWHRFNKCCYVLAN